MILSAAISEFLLSMKGVLSDKTVLFYQNRLPSMVSYLGDKPLELVTLSELRTWRSFLTDKTTRYDKGSSRPPASGGYSPYTIHQYIRGCKRFFLWCVEEGLIEKNPARRLEKPHLPKIRAKGITSNQLDLLLVAAGRGSAEPEAAINKLRDVSIILFLADTACRVGGIAALCLNDLDLSNCQATIREKGRGGWGKERVVFFTEHTRDVIGAWLEDRSYRDLPGDSLFGLGTDGIYQMLKRTAKRAGVVDNWNPHSFRHAAIRAWLNNGMPISEVATLAGHSTVKVTADVYGVVSDQVLQRDYVKYNWLCKA